MTIQDRLTPQVCTQMARAIQEADGAEVLFIGRLDAEGRVDRIEAAARGNDEGVPALEPFMEKGDMILHNHPSGLLKPSGADLSVASRLGQMGIGSAIVDNPVSQIYVVAEPILLREADYLDREEVASHLEEGGSLDQHQKGFEVRESQVDMARDVASAFNDNAVLAAEAGTGVGKSYAYLIPAVLWAVRNEQRVVISTATINLQQQILEKDIPRVLDFLKVDLKAVLVKGRGNYICRRRLMEAQGENALFLQEAGPLDQLVHWAEASPTGSKSDLPYYVEPALWSQVNSEADLCTGIHCPFREECFVLKTRREAASAGLLVVNHHLLFSDAAMRLEGSGFDNSAVLPPFRKIVFDEAHNIEESASSFFSQALNRFSLFRLLSRLLKGRGGSRRGLIARLEQLAPQGGSPGQPAAELPGLVDKIRTLMEVLDAQALALLSEQGESTLRLKPDLPVPESLSQMILEPLRGLQKAILKLCEALDDLIRSLSEELKEESAVIETRGIIRRLEALALVGEKFPRYPEFPGQVFWLEKRATSKGDPFCRYIITPLSIAETMVEALYEPYDTVVFTSATLTVGGKFTYWGTRVGLGLLPEEIRRFALYPSPFNYPERVCLGIPRDAPAPQEPSFTDYVADTVTRAVKASQGRALILFTSYRMLEEVCSAVRSRSEGEDFSIYRQGEDDRGRLLSRFNTETASVLMATESFWEGVDAPGDALRLVVIAKLPFRVPTHPVTQARVEALEKSGRNSFMEFSLPEAVMKLKQGFGRLMRRRSDHGMVLILDSRLINKRYGSIFLRSLPPARQKVEFTAGLMEGIPAFLSDRREN